jgi:hypothetical protein
MESSEELRCKGESVGGLRSAVSEGSGTDTSGMVTDSGCETAGAETTGSETLGVSTCSGLVAGGVGVRLSSGASFGGGFDALSGGGRGVGGA